MSLPAAPRRRVLFLYNVDGWAIHNVGLDWASLIADTHEVTLASFGRHERLDPAAWDHVVWGYSTLRHSGRMLLESLGRRPRSWLRWSRPTPRWRAVVQDPSEIYPEVPAWTEAPARTDHLRRFAALAVTSNEMQQALARLGFATCKVNTRSRLPLRDPASVDAAGPRLFTRALPYPRKNLALFERLRRRVGGAVERCDALVGGPVLAADAYVRLLDEYNVYVCTSWQEGGPLPLADALRRGCVALTTRVGQTDELVEDGENGFFCSDEEAFVDRIRRLSEDRALLRRMRLRALELAADRRDEVVRAQLRAFLP